METENKKVTPGKLATAIAVVVLLLAALVALVLTGMATRSDEETVQEAEVVYTIPADGNPDDETAKGTYTVSDEEALAARETVVARIGDKTLTNGQLQVYYWMQVQDFLNNYGSMAASLNLDYTKPLDQQTCPIVQTPCTWQQFFLSSALKTWKNYQTLSIEAEAADFQLPAEAQLVLDNMELSLAQDAAMYGMESAEEYLAAMVGGGAAIEDFASYVEQSYRGMLYFDELCLANKPSAEEVEAYFTENEAAYEANGLSRDSKYVTARHVLIMPEGADSSTIRTEEFGEEAWAAAETKAQALLAEFEAGDKSEDSFADLAIQHSQDGSAADGGNLGEFTQGQMVEEFEAWCFDEARKPGDYGLVKTMFGYHLMYYVSDRPMWMESVEQEMMMNLSRELLDEVLAKYELEAEYGEVRLAKVNLGGEAQEEAEPKSYTVLLVIAGVSIAALAAAAYVFTKKEEEL